MNVFTHNKVKQAVFSVINDRRMLSQRVSKTGQINSELTLILLLV